MKGMKFSSETHKILVNVTPRFKSDLSDSTKSSYIWGYHVRIENLSQNIVQLHSRFLQIIDKNGQSEEVRGPGVVGQQPIIYPGQSYEYSSQVKLFTNSGMVRGYYFMVNQDNDEEFQVEIPTFSLDMEESEVFAN